MSYPFPTTFNATPDTLYHYTTVSGLEGILSSSTLFATHIGYLNDAEEMKHGVSQIEQILSRTSDLVAATAIKRPEYGDQVLDYIDQLRSEFTSSHHQSLVKQPYVTCLSEMSDQLSQWRGYGGNGGYAIHFDTKLLSRSVRTKGLEGPLRPGELTLLQQIAYHPGQASVYLSGIMDRFADAICEQAEEPHNSSRDAVALPYEFSLIELQNVIAVMKNPAFDEEREFRIVAHPPDEWWDQDSCFHVGSSIGLIPRIRISFDPGCIIGVTVGPGENMQLRQQSLEHYFDMHCDTYPSVQVTESGVPFRPI